MLALRFDFLAGRYHATEWDRHVNEGSIEWPPSPWRILRALVSASYRAEVPVAHAQAVVSALSAPPVYALPRTSSAHLRHYMPIPGSTTLVIDAFAVTEGGAHSPASLVVAWPEVALSAEQISVLRSICDHVGYLGRGESWVAATVATDWHGKANAVPVGEGGAATNDDASFVTLPALEAPALYAAWRQGFVDAQIGKKKRLPPETLWDALHADTAALQKDGWSRAPGMRPVRYAVDSSALANVRAPSVARAKAVPVVRFRIQSAVSPSLRDAVSIGERMRQAAMSHSDRILGRQLTVFTGKAENGEPAQGHAHAYWLAEDRDSDGFVDHLVGFAPGGFDDDARRVLGEVRRLWGRSGHDLELVLIESGTAAELGTTLAQGGPTHSPLLGSATEWVSRTPFVPPRHLKKGDGPEDQLRRLLEKNGYPEPVRIDPYRSAFVDEPGTRHKPIAWLEFRRERGNGFGARGSSQGFGFRLQFEQPVRGPLALGYGAHYGLGQFVAVR
jgi:CRISPR-associated protein Csb2